MKYLIFITLIPHAVFSEQKPCSRLFTDNMSYEDARTFSRSLRLADLKDFLDILVYEKELLPENFPSNPKAFYKVRGEWKGWEDFLGMEENKLEHRGIQWSQFSEESRVAYENFLSGIDSYTDKTLWLENDFLDIINQIVDGSIQVDRGMSEEKDKVDILGRLHKGGKLKEEYRGFQGHTHYADKFHNGHRRRAYDAVSDVLSMEEMDWFGWQPDDSGVTEAGKERIRRSLYNEDGQLKEEYKGVEGFIHYAEKFYNGYLGIASDLIEDTLSLEELNQIGWQGYLRSQGNTRHYKQRRLRIVDQSGKKREEYKSVGGLISYADTFHKGHIGRAYNSVSDILSEKEFNQLEWPEPEEYQVATMEYKESHLVFDDPSEFLNWRVGTK